ncbi:uncharacterized protein LOC110851546 isoform X1 [Folsomia candida]|uniref:uncharacterized protein LOC110851546 isoform X1 n=1 Tax=Folsomia candida TaxID=158441 RepID=UPI00160515CB|nr:uncharacterized protein LOC110851546 isoform X1 [Folsomia candida]
MLSIPDIHHSIVQHNTWQWLELKNGKTTHSRLPELAFHQNEVSMSAHSKVIKGQNSWCLCDGLQTPMILKIIILFVTRPFVATVKGDALPRYLRSSNRDVEGVRYQETCLGVHGDLKNIQHSHLLPR